MDQSLRTLATQLLNVSNHEAPPKILDNLIKKPNGSQKPIEKNEVTSIKEINVNNGQSSSVGYGRPVNSKFGYFDTSHPGQAMAITEEELEREMSSTRLMTAYKNQATTTGGISTWILLNPPSTTVKTIEAEKKTKAPSETEVKMTVRPTTSMEQVETTERVIEKATMPVSTTTVTEEPSTTKKSVTVTTKKTTEAKPEKTPSTEKMESVPTTTAKVSQTTMDTSDSKETTITTKKVQIVRTTPKPKIVTVKTTVLSKPSGPKTPRPNQQSRPKPPMRRPTVKPDTAKNESISTGKVEKVTFRPVQMITIPKNKVENTEKPMFVTKIKASILMETQKTTTQPSVPTTTSFEVTTTPKSSDSNTDLVPVPVKPKPIGTKVSNVLKVQLKKPLDEATRIEIEPIKVNAPVLKIEKVEKEDAKKEDAEKETDSLDNTRIDSMKFDFNPELTKINVNTDVSSSSSTSTTPSTTSTSTTKRPRNNSKRKKNKGRRRKPATSTTTTISPLVVSSTKSELITEETIVENGIQESKIVPETKVAGNGTKTKKKPAATPISMQIYNYLSREVMPSFGVMSLVGLGLGLASYFLYPFGGTVTRRNYEVEPKYKYNFDEYGGNYGQNEEEVLSKVLQGMTSDEIKYPGPKDYDNNYYKYQHYDGGYDPQITKKSDQRYPSSSPMYRPENTASVLKYKNTDYRYSDTPSTPNYYDRPKPSEYVVGSVAPGSVNRQFVVGSVPKDYPPYDEKIPSLSTTGKLPNGYEPTESVQMQFDRDTNQNFNYPVASIQKYGQTQTARPEETYEEVEITPTAVAVEHGPRSLRIKRSLLDPPLTLLSKIYGSRRKRDSVIQVIPTKREMEEELKEEDLSNEIVNIIDSVLLEEDYANVKKKKNKFTEEDFVNQRRKEKEKEKEKTRLKGETTTSQNLETSTTTSTDPSVVSSATKATTDSSISIEMDTEGTTATSSKTTEQSSVEWAEPTTQKSTEQSSVEWAEPTTQKSTEPTTQKSTEPTTQKSTEPTTKKPTEPTTQKLTEPTTKKPTEPITQKPFVPITQKPFVPITQKPFVPITQKPFVPITQKPFVPITQKPFVPITQKPFVPITQKPIEPITQKPTESNGYNFFNIMKKIAEVKLRLGLTILKHASEGFARYLGHVQKRFNGEE